MSQHNQQLEKENNKIKKENDNLNQVLSSFNLNTLIKKKI